MLGFSLGLGLKARIFALPGLDLDLDIGLVLYGLVDITGSDTNLLTFSTAIIVLAL